MTAEDRHRLVQLASGLKPRVSGVTRGTRAGSATPETRATRVSCTARFGSSQSDWAAEDWEEHFHERARLREMDEDLPRSMQNALPSRTRSRSGWRFIPHPRLRRKPGACTAASPMIHTVPCCPSLRQTMGTRGFMISVMVLGFKGVAQRLERLSSSVEACGVVRAKISSASVCSPKRRVSRAVVCGIKARC